MIKSLSQIVIACLVLVVSTSSSASEERRYEVTITNITRGVQFTPILVATHHPAIQAFTLGQPALPELALLAEGGDIGPLEALAVSTGMVSDTANSAEVLPGPPLLFPGQSVTLTITAYGKARRLSLAAMLLPTNDSFVALNSVELPKRGSVSYNALGYDAGSEPNDEICANIPGPRCGGAGASPDESGEGFVHISAGIQGVGDLSSSVYDWRNPVARVFIQRMDR
ncbi:MAG: spondin domain-containing protein [Pseudomonadota bacterium]